MEAKGAPYDPVRIVVTPFVKDMKLEYDRSYASICIPCKECL